MENALESGEKVFFNPSFVRASVILPISSIQRKFLMELGDPVWEQDMSLLVDLVSNCISNSLSFL